MPSRKRHSAGSLLAIPFFCYLTRDSTGPHSRTDTRRSTGAAQRRERRGHSRLRGTVNVTTQALSTQIKTRRGT
eukprot:1242782-Pyramimonas_sp.AAC.1